MGIFIPIMLFIGLESSFIDINKISKINDIKSKAEEYYKSENYEEAIRFYRILIDSFSVEEGPIWFNLGNSYFYTQNTDLAIETYKLATLNGDNDDISIAYNQLGVLKSQKQDYTGALESFKSALLSDHFNEEARYNYELLKKLLNEKEDSTSQQDSDKNDSSKEDNNTKESSDKQEESSEDQENSSEDQENSNKDDSNEENNEAEDSSNSSDQQSGEEQDKRLEEINISEEVARRILEAMKNDEIKYYQQLKKGKKKQNNSTKPDW